MRRFTSIVAGLLLVSALLSGCDQPSTPLQWSTPPGAAAVSAHDVTAFYLQSLRLANEKNDAGTEISLRGKDELPWIRLQIYDVPVTPEFALTTGISEHKKMCESKGWAHEEKPATERIAGEVVKGTESIYKVKETEFRSRYFTLRVHRRTVLLMTMSKTEDDDLTRKYLALVRASLH